MPQSLRVDDWRRVASGKSFLAVVAAAVAAGVGDAVAAVQGSPDGRKKEADNFQPSW